MRIELLSKKFSGNEYDEKLLEKIEKKINTEILFITEEEKKLIEVGEYEKKNIFNR